MESLLPILQAVSYAASTAGSAVAFGPAVVKYLRDFWRPKKSADVLKFLHDLGAASDAQVRKLVAEWDAPGGVTPAAKGELADLLVNLVRGARFHTTQGTALSSYLRCERLIEQLVQNLQPVRRKGDTLPGGWRLDSFLGMGSFGEVWSGSNPLHPDRRAFKMFTRPGAAEWLNREGKTLYAVRQHLAGQPTVIGYLDVALDASPHPYLVLEYVEGGSLEDWILTPPDDRISLDRAEVVEGVVRGLAEAHRHGITHRDLKPANVLLTPAGLPKVADFGLGHVDPTGAAATGSAGASQAVVIGTRMYLPPEAADPYAARQPTQDDVFALGVLWYQVLTGRLERPPYDFADRLAEADVDSRTVRLVARCLAHPDRRYADAGSLLVELEAAAAPGPGDWEVPADGFEVGAVAREYVNSLTR